MNGWLLALLQTALFVFGAPLLTGWIKWVKCRLQNRQGPPPWQPYRDLAKLFRKEVVVADTASPIFRFAPYLIFSTTILAGSVIPIIMVDLPASAIADVIVLVGFFALIRFFLALAGMDVGTAFGGMGSSREVTISALAEPAMLLAVFTLVMTVASTNLSTVIGYLATTPFHLHPSFIFAAMAMVMVAMAETGRIPVDNPATHLELTMIHEAMILEYSGRHLAMLEWAAMMKLFIYAVLIANLFIPWGVALTHAPAAMAVGLVAVAVKLWGLGLLVAVTETGLAKMRLFRVPQLLGLALILSLIGMLSHVILEVR
jgi:formate hydrogenlyase subunit 4